MSLESESNEDDVVDDSLDKSGESAESSDVIIFSSKYCLSFLTFSRDFRDITTGCVEFCDVSWHFRSVSRRDCRTAERDIWLAESVECERLFFLWFLSDFRSVLTLSRDNRRVSFFSVSFDGCSLDVGLFLRYVNRLCRRFSKWKQLWFQKIENYKLMKCLKMGFD